MAAEQPTEQLTPDFEPTDSMRMVQETARNFAEKEIRPTVMKFDESMEFPREIVNKLGALGFMGAIFPEEYGGAGLGYLEYVGIIEEISRVDPSVGLTIAAHNSLCSNHIFTFGNESQKRKYLPDLTTARKIGAWALTEPSSGSDAGGMLTTAVKDGNSYILNGSKNFITHGSVGKTTVVMAVSKKELGKKGISAFIVENDTPGFTVVKKENKLGVRCCDTAAIAAGAAMVPLLFGGFLPVLVELWPTTMSSVAMAMAGGEAPHLPTILSWAVVVIGLGVAGLAIFQREDM